MRTAEEIYDGYLNHLGSISRETTITMMKLYHSEQYKPTPSTIQQEGEARKEYLLYPRRDFERPHITTDKKYGDFFRELTSLINRHSKDSEAGTPDYVLAEYMISSLKTFCSTLENRVAHMYGGNPPYYIKGEEESSLTKTEVNKLVKSARDGRLELNKEIASLEQQLQAKDEEIRKLVEALKAVKNDIQRSPDQPYIQSNKTEVKGKLGPHDRDDRLL